MRIGILGCSGRMGRSIMAEILANEPALKIAGGTVSPGSAANGIDIGTLVGKEPLGVFSHTNTQELVEKSDILIDFTCPQATLSHVEVCAAFNKPLVIGTTGLKKDEKDIVLQKGQCIPMVFAPNMSVGVTILRSIVERVAAMLDDTYDIEIVEAHHRYKKDAPSGTAINLAKAAARGRQKEDRNWVTSRAGEREPGSIGMNCIRGGQVAGEHEVMFLGNGESLHFKHKAEDRRIFSIGAIQAAKWLMHKPAGVYSMKDVLGIDI